MQRIFDNSTHLLMPAIRLVGSVRAFCSMASRVS